MGLRINRLSETGGPPLPLGVLDKAANEAAQLRPVFLSDGRRFLYQSVRSGGGTAAIILASLDSERRQTLDVTDTRIVWAGDDRVIFRRADALYVQAITYDPLALVGEPTQLVAEVAAGIVSSYRESASPPACLRTPSVQTAGSSFDGTGGMAAAQAPPVKLGSTAHSSVERPATNRGQRPVGIR